MNQTLIDPIDFELSITAKLESLLFVAPGPVTVNQLAATLEIDPETIIDGLIELEKKYLNPIFNSGIRLQKNRDRYQLTTAPEAAIIIERFLGLDAGTRLSKASLEALAIIAYRQPTTRPIIESIRGVSSDGVIKSLLDKGLIQEIGRADSPGRPILYTTTSDFLQSFGFNSLDDLPPLERL
jgi:segregation and condensation protein B